MAEEEACMDVDNTKKWKAYHSLNSRPKDRKSWPQDLHHILWGKNTDPTYVGRQGAIAIEEDIDVPLFNSHTDDGALVPWRERYKARFVDINEAVKELREKEGSQDKIHDRHFKKLLPCGTDRLLFRPAYAEAIQHMEKAEISRGYMRDPNARNLDWKGKTERSINKSAYIFTGHPGIGKTWFLSALLAHRLMAGRATVLQVGNPDRAKHILFDETGARFIMEDDEDDPAYSRSDIWALVDQKPRGILRDSTIYEWFSRSRMDAGFNVVSQDW